MTNRELLEMAAKAAEMKLHWPYDQEWNDWQTPYSGGKEWNPLEDDGDALRLAVGLKIDLLHTHIHSSQVHALADNRVLVREDSSIDPYDATRRAIVRAAAEIGKAMP